MWCLQRAALDDSGEQGEPSASWIIEACADSSIFTASELNNLLGNYLKLSVFKIILIN